MDPLKKKNSIPVGKAELPFSNGLVLAEPHTSAIPVHTSHTSHTSAEQIDPYRWLGAVLRADTVPLYVVTIRARLEGWTSKTFGLPSGTAAFNSMGLVAPGAGQINEFEFGSNHFFGKIRKVFELILQISKSSNNLPKVYKLSSVKLTISFTYR